MVVYRSPMEKILDQNENNTVITNRLPVCMLVEQDTGHYKQEQKKLTCIQTPDVCGIYAGDARF
jgi:hypothetical protein